MWPMLKQAIPKRNIAVKNENDLMIQIAGYDSKVFLMGAEDPDNLRGNKIHFLVMDEMQDIDLDTFDTVLFPAMTDKGVEGEGFFIGTPKGKGNNALYNLYLRGKTQEMEYEDWKSWVFTTLEGGNVSPEQIAAAKRQMTEKMFRQEFEASFDVLSGRIYYNFSLDENVTPEAKDNGTTLHIGMDFNVTPFCAVIGNIVDGKYIIFDEIELEDSNTFEACTVISNRYPGRDIVVYPDASGKNRSTKAMYGQTDHSIMRDHFGFQVMTKSANPKVSDRINDVNAMLCNADGDRNVLIHPSCMGIIKSLDGHTYKEGTNVPDEKSGLDHFNDSLGYLLHYKFSIIKREAKILQIDWNY